VVVVVVVVGIVIADSVGSNDNTRDFFFSMGDSVKAKAGGNLDGEGEEVERLGMVVVVVVVVVVVAVVVVEDRHAAANRGACEPKAPNNSSISGSTPSVSSAFVSCVGRLEWRWVGDHL
jgi:hypothetical protein